MKVLTKYLLRSHIGPFLFAFVTLTGVILINTLAKEMAGLAGKGLSVRVLLEFFILSLPANIALTLPMSVLVAVLYTFSQLSAENEITALRASGIDLKRLIAPLLLVAGIIAGGMIWFNNSVLPASNFRWKQLMVDIAQTSPLLALQEQTINPIQTMDGMSRFYLQAGRIEPITGELTDVAIYDVSAPGIARTIYADSGTMAFNAARTDLVLTLYDGLVREMEFSQPQNFQTVAFKRQVRRMSGVASRLDRSAGMEYRSDREMTVGMMETRIDSLRTELRELELEEAGPTEIAPPSAGLRTSGEERAENLTSRIREFQVEVQKKFSIAIATLVFVLIGVPLALRFPQGGIGMVIAASLIIFGIYYVGLIGGETLGDKGYVHPTVAMWAINVIFGVLGIIGIWRIGREHSTGRDSGWGELPKWLRFR
ncbi:MAG TPA: LptF/LptG family permease [Longimicrobiaceae bacterium]|nr:LptF/LptG family permease [Longimicrobiaceae bacterium]